MKGLIKLQAGNTIPDKIKLGLANAARVAAAPNFFYTIPNVFIDGMNAPNPSSTFLLSPKKQKEYMEGLGYTLVDDQNYGMVNKATIALLKDLNLDKIPIYQLGKDDASPEDVTLVSIDPTVIEPYLHRVPDEKKLQSAGKYPSALYKSNNGEDYYIKSWDLNDYGDHGYAGKKYGILQKLANWYDSKGTPFIQRTGLIKVPSYADYYKRNMEITHFEEDPPVSKLSDLYAKGGILKGKSGIHIKKANRGKFTDYCGGKVTSKCIARGKASSSPTIRKRATFAANARKWKHKFGGKIIPFWMYSVLGGE